MAEQPVHTSCISIFKEERKKKKSNMIIIYIHEMDINLRKMRKIYETMST